MIWLLLAISEPTLDAEIEACSSKEETRPLTLCLAERSFERAEDRLNAQWSFTFAHVKDIDGNETAGKLRKAQRSWIKKRDQECIAEAAPTPVTQQGRNLMSCLAIRTDKRTNELRQIAETK